MQDPETALGESFLAMRTWCGLRMSSRGLPRIESSRFNAAASQRDQRIPAAPVLGDRLLEPGILRVCMVGNDYLQPTAKLADGAVDQLEQRVHSSTRTRPRARKVDAVGKCSLCINVPTAAAAAY